MGKNTSYKSMLRDRCPYVVDLALKWCKAKTCWTNHVYDNFIGILADKDERYAATKATLGEGKHAGKFDFHKTINWDNLDEESYNSWKNVEWWVKMIQDEYTFIESHYNNFMQYSSKEEISDYIVTTHLTGYALDEDVKYRFANFIADALQNN